MQTLQQRQYKRRAWLGRAARLALGAALLTLTAANIDGPRAARASSDTYCYAVNCQTVNARYLTRIDPLDADPATNETTLGLTNTHATEALALQPGTGTVYSVDAYVITQTATIGTLNTTTGSYTALPNALGTGQGALGAVPLYAISGLTFDPATGVLYGSHIRWTGSQNLPDVLFQVNVQTGRVITNAFGSGKDYVVLNAPAGFPALSDIDDIAIHPVTGQMYGIANNSTTGDRLVKINKATGAVLDVGPLGVDEVEGLSFDASGALWAIAGGDEFLPNQLYRVDRLTGAASEPRPVDDGVNYEALACVAPPQVVWRIFLPIIRR